MMSVNERCFFSSLKFCNYRGRLELLWWQISPWCIDGSVFRLDEKRVYRGCSWYPLPVDHQQRHLYMYCHLVRKKQQCYPYINCHLVERKRNNSFPWGSSKTLISYFPQNNLKKNSCWKKRLSSAMFTYTATWWKEKETWFSLKTFISDFPQNILKKLYEWNMGTVTYSLLMYHCCFHTIAIWAKFGNHWKGFTCLH